MILSFICVGVFICGVAVGWFAAWYVVYHVYED
jgi:hypothetical protein